MRKLLSVLLAITMVLTSVVFAAPSAVSTMDSAEEIMVGGDDVANLAADAGTLYRGINFMTGTKDAFDGDNYTDLSWLTKNVEDNVLEIIDDPTGERDKVISMTFPAGTTSGYPNYRVNFNGDLDTDIGHTYVYIAFDYQKYVADPSGYISSKAFWLLNTYATSGDFAPFSKEVDANEGWVHYGQFLDYSVNNTGLEIDNNATNQYYTGQDINKSMIIQFSVNQTNTSDVQMLFDNFVFAPAYKVTYYNKAGTDVVKEEFMVVDEEGNLLSSFAPATLLSGGKAYGNWALSKNGAAVSEVALTENADIVLYATVEEDIFSTAKVVLDKKLTKKGAKATATAVFATDVAFDPAKVTWTIADSDVAIVNYDKDKGIATVTARGEGRTDITFTYDGTSFTDTITVADGPVVATNVTSGSAISEFADRDLDVYEYITFNVTNTSGSAKTLSVDLNDADAGSDIGINFSSYEVTVPAGANGMDVYLDLSDEDAWTGDSESVVATVSGVTINNAKLWAELNVENGIGFEADKNLITEAGDKATVNVFCSSDLEGVYGEDYTITVEADASANYAINGNVVTITAVSGNGSAVIKAVSKEDASVKAEKEILIRVVEGKGIAYKWDFNNASKTGFSLSGRYTASEFTGTTANVRAVYAKLPDTTQAVPVELGKGTVSGKTVTKVVKYGESLYGTMTSDEQKGVFKVTEYPYLVIKARSNTEASHKLGIYMMYSGHDWGEDKTKINVDVSLTNDWKLYVIDASESAAFAESDSGVSGQTFKQMMFSTNQHSTITNEVSKSGSTYYYDGAINYEPDYNIEIDEMYFANYDPTKIYYGVSLKADKTELDGDGIITLHSEVFGSDVVANDGVNYTVDKEGYVSILKNSDGTATVTPLKNGTVTITASSVMDETAKDSITLTLTNIPTRTVAYDLKLMLIGNSYLEHGYLATADKTLYNGYLDKTDVPRGMAATSPELDYYSRLCYYLTEGFEGTFVSKKQGGAVIEQAWKQGLASGTPTNLEGWDKDKSLTAMKGQWQGILDYMDREQPNLITIQLAENAAHAYEASAEWFYRELYKVIDEHRPENSIVVIISPMGTAAASKVQSRIASEYGFYWADNTWIGDEYGWGASNPYLAFQHYPDYTNASVVEFRSHPGNLGMDEIAKSAYAIFKEQIPTTIPATLVTIPDSIEIKGVNAISTEGGTVQLNAKLTPASAAPGVIWSVDNENLASVDETGLFTAKLNGTVTVTVKSAYDETITDTHTITITGQPQHYTLTYAAGTEDAVTGLPEAFDYAAGNYTFPALVAPPERNGYKFLGWSEKVNGEVAESIAMTGAKTVYAVWAFADSWTFDKDGDLEGIMVAGFNTKVADGVMSTISYDGIAVGFSDNTLLLNADLYNKFVANISMSTVNEGDYFTLTLTTTEGVKTYTANTLVGANDYYFDISDAEGMITGFSLVTSNDADGVGMTADYAKFIKTELKEDKTYETLNVSSDTILEAGENLITINAANFANGASLTLGAGSYVIGNITGTANIKASANANVIVTGATKPEGYVEIEIGAKTGTRYAEVNGNQYKISEADGNTKYGVILEDENLLVEIVDVGASTTTRYFLANAAEGTFKEVPMGNHMSNYGSRDLRIPDDKLPSAGIRFKAQVTTASKNETVEYKVNEYGYIVALEEVVNNNGGQLNFDLTRADGNKAYATGKAYVKGEFDKVFDMSDDNVHIFTSVLYGCAPENYGRRIVVKTYTVVTINGEKFVVYGQPMVESYYSMAKEIKNNPDLSDEAKALIDGIIAEGEDFGNEEGLPGDGLWS